MIKKKGLVIHPCEISQRWNDLIVDSGLNLLGIHPEGGLTAGQSVEEAIETLQRPTIKELLTQLEASGVGIEHELHALSWLLPRDLYSKHPNWFRMDEKQERVNDYDFCPSNKDALDHIAERAAQLAQIFRPTTGLYHFWLDDVEMSGCWCSDCKRSGYSTSDFAMLVYNTILTGIRTVFPDAGQCYLAYHGTVQAPRKIEPVDGIFLEFAPMDRDLKVPLNDSSSAKNLLQIEPLDELFRAFGHKNSKALDYWLDNSWLSNWKRPPQKLVLEDTALIQADSAFYADQGFETITTFACFLGDDYFECHGESPDIAAYAAALPHD
jgi:hypothetical protein